MDDIKVQNEGQFRLNQRRVLELLLEESGKSIRQLADDANMNVMRLRRCISGKYTLSAYEVVKLSTALNKTDEYLMKKLKNGKVDEMAARSAKAFEGGNAFMNKDRHPIYKEYIRLKESYQQACHPMHEDYRKGFLDGNPVSIEAHDIYLKYMEAAKAWEDVIGEKIANSKWGAVIKYPHFSNEIPPKLIKPQLDIKITY